MTTRTNGISNRQSLATSLPYLETDRTAGRPRHPSNNLLAKKEIAKIQMLSRKDSENDVLPKVQGTKG